MERLKRFLGIFIAATLLTQPVMASQVSDVVLEAGISGTVLRTQQNDINAAFNTMHKGSSRPGSVAAGTAWIDDSGGATAWLLKVYDGSNDITVGTFNTTADTFTPSGQLATFATSNVSRTANFSMDSTDYAKFIKVDSTSGNVTASISTVSGLGTSWYTIIQKTDSTANTVVIDPNSTEQVNGATTYTIRYQNEGIILIKDGSAFRALPFGNINVMKVSSDDTTPGFIEDKITATSPIALTTNNNGANETRDIGLTLATNPGLENSSGLRVKVGTGLTRDASGVNVDVGTTANKIVQLNGSAQLPAVSGALLTNLPTTGLSSMQVFTGSGTWNRPSGVKNLFVIVVGGGGGGGASGATGGGASSFGGYCTANGGSAGSGASGGAGGTASGGMVNLQGGAGFPSYQNTGSLIYVPGMGGIGLFGGIGANAGASAYANTGAGGNGISSSSGVAGGGGAGGTCMNVIDVSAVSSVSVTVGGGGGGGSLPSAGAGAAGIVIVLEFK